MIIKSNNEASKYQVRKFRTFSTSKVFGYDPYDDPYDNDPYADDPYSGDCGSYSDDVSEFFGLEASFNELGEVDLYKVYKSINEGNLECDATKICTLMALQAAAEAANTHKLVTRIKRSSGNYWVSWLDSKGVQNLDIKSAREACKDYNVSINIKDLTSIDDPIDMLSEDYPNDYPNDYHDSYDDPYNDPYNDPYYDDGWGDYYDPDNDPYNDPYYDDGWDD